MHKALNNLSVALVYDRVNTPYGGAEVVLLALSKLFNNAPICTSLYHPQKAGWAKKLKIIPSFLQKIPFFQDKHQLLLPLMPLAFESFDLSAYDIVISVTSAEAKGILTKPHQLHVCYLLTPPRYLYSHAATYQNSKWYLQLPLISHLFKLIISYLTYWDQSASTRPDYIIPISTLVASRVSRYYNRTPQKVIYPPVDIPLTQEQIQAIPFFADTHRFYLSLSRLVSYKRIDISILACLQLGKILVVAGAGEAEQHLHTLAGTHACVRQKDEALEAFLQRATKEEKLIWFTGLVTQEETYKLYKNCEVLLMPGQEDFGISALEAGIFGKAVILFYTSGVAELLTNNTHAVYITKETVPEMVYALAKFESLELESTQIQENARKHSVSAFQAAFLQNILITLKGTYVVS